jgi:rSAM/selenodomain-associated transferase 1
MVHPQPDRALLFSASQDPNATASISLTGRFSMKSLSQTTVCPPSQNRTLVIMAKAPKPGMVKTRLAQSLPSPAVTALYRCLLEDTVALGKSVSGVELAVMCPESDTDELTQLLGNTVQIVAQKGDGLAAGLTSVFRHFAAGGQHVIAFNSDSPHLSPSVLDSAFEILATHDVVVGPTHDGGYYLVGAKEAHPSLFEGDGMGTKSALDRLLLRTRVLELSTGFTEPFYDIDVADDLIRLARELRLAPARAPQTADWFAEWGQEVAQLRPRIGDL